MKFKDIPILEEVIGNYKVEVDPRGTKFDFDFFERGIHYLMADVYIGRNKDMGIYEWKLTKKGFIKELVDYVDKDDVSLSVIEVNISKYSELKRDHNVRAYFEDRDTNPTIVKELKNVLREIVKKYKPYSRKLKRGFEY